jgi:hypothetical protein
MSVTRLLAQIAGVLVGGGIALYALGAFDAKTAAPQPLEPSCAADLKTCLDGAGGKFAYHVCWKQYHVCIGSDQPVSL